MIVNVEPGVKEHINEIVKQFENDVINEQQYYL